MRKTDASRRRAISLAVAPATGDGKAPLAVEVTHDGPGGLAVRELNRAGLDRAFCLIELAIPGVDPARWRAFAGSNTHGKNPAQGILVLENKRGYLFALSAYRVLPGFPEDPILAVDHVVIPKLVDQKLAMALLSRAWEDIARRAGCRAIRTLLPIQRDQGAGAQGLLAAAAEFGYRAECNCLIKPLN